LTLEPWKIQRDRSQAEVCSRGGCALAGEPEYYAVLELPECVRRQVCLTCFHELKSKSEELPFHWKVRRRSDGRKQAVLDLTSLRALFDRLGEAADEFNGIDDIEDPDDECDEADVDAKARAEGLRYLVALLLLRKRVLRMADARNSKEERCDLLVIDPKIEGMEPVALYAPSLEPEALAALKNELTAALGSSEEAAAD